MERIERGAAISPGDPPVYYDILAARERPDLPWVVMVHGAAHTGSCYLLTADGRPGWASVFSGNGFRVAVPDLPGSGRSAALPPDRLDGEAVCRGLGALIDELNGPVVLMTHSMAGAYGWRLLETHRDKIAALVAVAPAPPGNIQPVAKIIERGPDFVEVEVLALRWRIPLDAPWWPDEKVVDEKIIGPSTRFPSDMRANYVANLKPVSPRLIYERQNVEGSQIDVTDTTRLRDKPVLIITGEHDIDHPREVDGAIADWLNDVGAKAEFHFLSDHGVGGNGHMLMLEDNSDDIAQWIAQWVKRTLDIG